MTDSNVEAVRQRLSDRAAVGLQKYGVTTERTDLRFVDWCRHLQDECLDAAVYAQRLIVEAVKLQHSDLTNAIHAITEWNHQRALCGAGCGPMSLVVDIELVVDLCPRVDLRLGDKRRQSTIAGWEQAAVEMIEDAMKEKP